MHNSSKYAVWPQASAISASDFSKFLLFAGHFPQKPPNFRHQFKGQNEKI